MLTLLVFIIILGLLVFVHELGHFVMARRNGIAAHEFGFGFPPRVVGVYKNEKGNWKIVWGGKGIKTRGTIYSLNAIPLGGFVKIKGEDGSEKNDPESFAGRSAWIRVKVLAAGVVMNFILAWLVLSLVFFMGAPQEKGESGGRAVAPSKIQIAQIISGTPSETMGLRVGDEIVGCSGENKICASAFSGINDVQDYISQNKGEEIILKIKRGKEELEVRGVPREVFPENQGPLGIFLLETVIVRFPLHVAAAKGAEAVWNMVVTILFTFGSIIKGLFVGQKVPVDVTGPIGIAYLTRQVTELGFRYILQFAAILSINLGIINILPFPALDGGRILFVIMEKIKGSPISQKVEQMIHSIGFALLILLMIFITFRDVAKFEIVDKIKNVF